MSTVRKTRKIKAHKTCTNINKTQIFTMNKIDVFFKFVFISKNLDSTEAIG